MLGIPYARVSSSSQTTGSGLIRQSADPEAYCRARGWQLWDGQAYSDPGVSAFAGDHLADGDLGRFLADHRAGRFGKQPVALLVEDVDRFRGKTSAPSRSGRIPWTCRRCCSG